MVMSSSRQVDPSPKATEARRDFLPENLWTVTEVAAFLRSSTSWVYKAAEKGELPCIRLGAMLRFDPQAIRALVAAAGQRPSTPISLRGRTD